MLLKVKEVQTEILPLKKFFKKRANRRKRYQKRKFISKSSPFSSAGNVRITAPVPQLRAPSNTTQFLMDDREQRETAEQPCGVAQRQRCYSVCSEIFGIPPATEMDVSTDSEVDDEENNYEFEREFDTVKLQTIEEMSRDQVSKIFVNKKLEPKMLKNFTNKNL